MINTKSKITKMPLLFIGHGSPENAIQMNEFTSTWKELGLNILKNYVVPKAILIISAHWMTDGLQVTGMEKPETIHDFYGFPEDMYEIQYRANGSPEIANLIQSELMPTKVKISQEWGLDHGAWSFLIHMFSNADIPVLQLSLDGKLTTKEHYEIGKKLSKLRDQGILIIGSGNIVHNLREIDFGGEPFEWAIEFDNYVKEALLKKDFQALINYRNSKVSEIAHPTNEHYLPLLYVVGAADLESEKIEFYNEKIVYGSLSMRCLIINENK
jgi:4,5-DOPA dioxygenase extradiol